MTFSCLENTFIDLSAKIYATSKHIEFALKKPETIYRILGFGDSSRKNRKKNKKKSIVMHLYFIHYGCKIELISLA